MVKQAIEQSRCDDGIAEELAPFGEAAVGGEDHGAFFVAGIDELEEQIATSWHHGLVADFIDDKERGPA